MLIVMPVGKNYNAPAIYKYNALFLELSNALLNLMKDISTFLPVSNKTPEMICTTWEDNRSCIKVAESPKFPALNTLP